MRNVKYVMELDSFSAASWRRVRITGVRDPGHLKAADSEKRKLMAAQPDAKTEERPQPDPDEKLIKVFDSEEESEALVVKGLLDSAGIESDLASASLLQDAFPGLGGMIIQVREEDAEKALKLITESRQQAASNELADEVDDDETQA